MASMARRVLTTSPPNEMPVAVEVPSASAARRNTRCDIDLSPGTLIVPVEDRRLSIQRDSCCLHRDAYVSLFECGPYSLDGAGGDGDLQHTAVTL